jgi:hypothetical protein
MLRVSFALVALSLGTAPVLAANQTAPATDPPAKPEPKICKKDRATGSLTRVNKICLTRSEWNEVNRKTKDALDEFTSRQNGQPRAPQNPTGM